MLINYVGTGYAAVFHIAQSNGSTVDIAHDTCLRAHNVAHSKNFTGIGIVDKAAHIVICGIGNHFLRRTDLHHAAVAQNADVCSQTEGFVDIVGDKNNGFAGLFLNTQQLEL